MSKRAPSEEDGSAFIAFTKIKTVFGKIELIGTHEGRSGAECYAKPIPIRHRQNSAMRTASTIENQVQLLAVRGAMSHTAKCD